MEAIDSNPIGSRNSLLPSPSTPKTPPSSPPGCQDSLLKNFVRANLNLYPLLTRVVKASYAPDNAGLNDDDIYYNTLLHHRIQKGSLLVFHGPTRQVRILARSSKDGRCFSIPSTYQGLFKILRKSFKSLEEFMAWKDVEDADKYKGFMAPKLDEIRIITIDAEYGHLLETGDIIRVKPISEQIDKSRDSVDSHLNVNNATLSSHCRNLGKVELEKLDGRNGGGVNVMVPYDLKVELEEVVKVDVDRIMWTVGRLTQLAQKQRLWVKLVEPGTDHPTQDEDLPCDVPLELIQVVAEPSVWVSDQTPDAPVFHLPTRMDIYLKIVKPLMVDSSPLLHKRRMVVSLLDRCVEHLPLPVFQELLKCKYHVTMPLEPRPITGEQARNGSKHSPTKPRPYSEIKLHTPTDQRPARKHGYLRHRSSPTHITRSPVIRKESILTRIIRSASTNEPPPMAYPKYSRYKVSRRTNSPTTRPKPVYLVAANNRRKHPAVTLTPATPKVEEQISQSFVDHEVPPRINANEQDDDNDFIASVMVGKRNKGNDPYASNSSNCLDQWGDSEELQPPARKRVTDLMGGVTNHSEDWNVFKFNFGTNMSSDGKILQKYGNDDYVTSVDNDYYNCIDIYDIDPLRIDQSENQDTCKSDAATDGSSKMSTKMSSNKNYDNDGDDEGEGDISDVRNIERNIETPNSDSDKMLLRKSHQITSTDTKPKEFKIISNRDSVMELSSFGPSKEIDDPFNEAVTVHSNEVVTSSFNGTSICPSIMACPLYDEHPSNESSKDPYRETTHSPYDETGNLSYPASRKTTNNKQLLKSSIRHITVINTLAPDDDENAINSYYKEQDDILATRGTSVKRSYSCNIKNVPYDSNKINYNNVINNNSYDNIYINNYNNVDDLDKKVFLEISLKAIGSVSSRPKVDKNDFEPKNVPPAKSSSDVELAELMKEMNLPHDGNLYNYDLEMFGEFLREFGFSESIIIDCANEEIDGRKFHQLSEKDLHDIGLCHPLIKFFKKKTYKPEVKGH